MNNEDFIEEEKLYDNDKEIDIVNPFDPKEVNIESKPMVLSNIVERLKDGDINLDPDFQRKPDLWDKKKQSRLIESLLIRIPLPIFYFDMPNDDDLIVVDGLQRLCAIRNFMAYKAEDERCLKLEGLEYLRELTGKSYYDLPGNLQRRLREQVIQTYLIKEGTPDKVRNSIFERINTGGMVLTSAEIRNSVYRGRAANLLKKMVEGTEFVLATDGKIKSERMLDREFANRFLAFYLLGIENYHENLDDFLNDVLIRVKNDDSIDCDDLVNRFSNALKLSRIIFGKEAFKKPRRDGKPGTMINKPLFEAVMVQFALLTADDRSELINNKDIFLTKYHELLSDDRFINVITNGTAKMSSVEFRHSEMRRIIVETLKAGG